MTTAELPGSSHGSHAAAEPARRPNPYPQQQCQAPWHAILAYFVEYGGQNNGHGHTSSSEGAIWNRASGVLWVGDGQATKPQTRTGDPTRNQSGPVAGYHPKGSE